MLQLQREWAVSEASRLKTRRGEPVTRRSLEQTPLGDLCGQVKTLRRHELHRVPEGDDERYGELRKVLRAKKATRHWATRISASYLEVQADHIKAWWEYIEKPFPGDEAILNSLKRLVSGVLTHPITIGQY